MDRKAQGAVEMIVIMAAGLAILVSIIAVNNDIMTPTSYMLERNKAKALIGDVGSAAELVYHQGVGAKTRIFVTVPMRVESIIAQERTIKLTFQNGEVVYRNTDFNVTGSIPANEGNLWVIVTSEEDLVRIQFDSYCGNGIREGDEECDGTDLGGETCVSQGYDSGTLACYIANCTFNFSGCIMDDDEDPVVTLEEPDDNSTVTTQTNTFNCSATDNQALSTMELWGNFTGSWELNDSCSVSGTYDSCVWSKTLDYGSYMWNCRATDSSGNDDWGDSNYTLTVSETATHMVIYYDGGASQTPRYRIWNESSLGSESPANDIGSDAMYYSVLKSCPTRSEKILGTVDTSSDVNFQVWDGSSWGDLIEASTNSNYNQQRNFDIAYETSSGDAIVTYISQSDDTLPRYRIWDGSSWSSEQTDVQEVSPAGYAIRWVKLASHPSSDEIIMVTMNNYWDLYAQVWNGSAWDDVVYLEDNPETVSYQNFDVVYEQQSGHAMVAWSDGGSNRPRYRIWDGSSWSSESSGNSVGSSNIYWVKLAADPQSDKIIVATLDSGRDLNVQVWDGSGFGSSQELDNNLESSTKRCFDVKFETTSGAGLIVYGQRNSDTPKYRIWDGSWSSQSSVFDSGGDPNWIVLEEDPDSDEMIMVLVENQNNDVSFQRWDGSSWSDYQEIETNSDSAYESLSVSYDRN